MLLKNLQNQKSSKVYYIKDFTKETWKFTKIFKEMSTKTTRKCHRNWKTWVQLWMELKELSKRLWWPCNKLTIIVVKRIGVWTIVSILLVPSIFPMSKPIILSSSSFIWSIGLHLKNFLWYSLYSMHYFIRIEIIEILYIKRIFREMQGDPNQINSWRSLNSWSLLVGKVKMCLTISSSFVFIVPCIIDKVIY